VQPLIEEMISRVQLSHGIAVRPDAEVLSMLKAYEWPGNVRELSNLVERLAVIRPNGAIRMSDLPWPLRPEKESPVVLASNLAADQQQDSDAFPEDGLDLKQHLAGIERNMIQSALDQSEGVVQKAAELLGLGRTTLVEKIRRHRLRT
jgi:sigma-54 specific flagellar transcriptional regulator A